MRRTLTLGVLTLTGCALLAAPAVAQVVVSGPFGRAIVVPAPITVRVGPGVFVGTPASRTVVGPAPIVVKPYQPTVVSKTPPVVRPPDADTDVLPQPRVLPGGGA